MIHQNTKTLKTRNNGRSSDAISPNFIYGCLGSCMASYCYVGRYNPDKVYINDNTDQILASIENWVKDKPNKIPNQVSDKYYMIDIECSTDIALHGKHYNWQKVFDYFNSHDKLKFTFATKYPSYFRNYELHKDNRIRISLMPQCYADVLEPKCNSIATRIENISILQEKLEVHLNFSPVIVHEGWLDRYEELFKLVEPFKSPTLKSEVIFLTYNQRSFERNTELVNSLLWKPDVQEVKNSEYVDNNIRYKWQMKAQWITEFKKLHKQYLGDTIRYIF